MISQGQVIVPTQRETQHEPQYKATVPQRLPHIDNLRIFLTSLVILHHLIVAYGASSGQWYYNDLQQATGLSWRTMTAIMVINQSFFMGLFFMLSSYFSPGSYDKKGGKAYLTGRLYRLGIPFVFYVVVVNPILTCIIWTQNNTPVDGFVSNGPIDDFFYFLPIYFEYYKALDVGVVWFVETLLIFSVLYFVWRRITDRRDRSSKRNHLQRRLQPQKQPWQLATPSDAQIFLFSLLLGVLSFLERMVLTDLPGLKVLGLTGDHFIQYIAFLIAGVLAYRNNWLMRLTREQGIFWRNVSAALLLSAPFVLAGSGIIRGQYHFYEIEAGKHGSSLFAFTLWEQLLCVSMTVALLVWFREKVHSQTKLTKAMAKSTYATYLTHTPVITWLVFAFKDVELIPELKFLLVAPLAIALSFLSGHWLRQLPILKGIL